MTTTSTDEPVSIAFYWDPMCPFAWMTSKWIRIVQTQRPLEVDWRLISLRLLNKNVDYETHFPKGYEDGHNAGLYLLRTAATIRAAEGREAMGPLFESFGRHIFDTPPQEGDRSDILARARTILDAVLADVGFDAAYAAAFDDESVDAEIDEETEGALALTGRDVGTPIIAFGPPDGPAFFGPVISRLPHPDEAARLWDLIAELVAYPGFAELKRSLREFPQLAAFGGDPDAVGKVEDWHGGSRKLKK